MGCGEFLVKYILFFANLFFALAGLTLLGLGVAVQVKFSLVTNLLDQSVEIAPIGAMVVGGIVFVIAFFGCCGAIRESNCMLVTYSVFMLVLMVLKITLATLIFVNMDSIVKDVPVWLNRLFSEDQTTFGELQTTFNCCGTTGPQSYLPAVSLPASCCDDSVCTPLNSFAGCNDIISDLFQTFGYIIGGVAVVVVAIELVAVVFGLCLANHARNKNRRTRY